MTRLLAVSALCLSLSSLVPCARAAPPEPGGAHPRLWLDATTLANMKRLAREGDNAVARAVRQCSRLAGRKQEEARNLYMGLDWGAHVSNCAIAWQATGDAKHAATALHFWKALLDDWETVGDGKGGDDAARHDSGFAIRAYGVHAAIGYDWLHDAPGMTEELRARARKRFAAWTDWYYGNGYRFKDPGNNYHSGYLFAVTLMAIAQAGEGGAASTRMWRHVVDQVWGREMKRESGKGGLLDGGDWGEGWQYGALAVASYALAARAMIEQGIPLPDMERFTADLYLRHVHALNPGESGIFVGGDTQSENPSLAPNPWLLSAVIAGPSPDQTAAWARAEMQRLGLATDDKTFLIFEALADARAVKPAPFPREERPTNYLARGTGVFFSRTSWSPGAVWMAVQCTKKIEVDHLPSNAGNFVVTRGSDELVVDPSPYGSLSSMTSNAPTVESAHLPADYKPSQAYWSVKTGYAWARQTASAIVAARCDYADQYKFQDRPSDVPMAVRDIVLLPGGDGNATLVVVDRAKTGGAARALYLRFRSLAQLAATGGAFRGTDGGSSLTVRPYALSSGKPELADVTKGDCFGSDTTRGACMAARFPVHDYRLKVNGPDAFALHVLDVAGADAQPPAPTVTEAKDHRVVTVPRGSVVIAQPGTKKLTYKAPAGRHVVLDAPADAGRATVTAAAGGGACTVTVTPGGTFDARPLVINVTSACAVTDDPTMTKPQPTSFDGAAPAPRPRGDSGTSPTQTGDPYADADAEREATRRRPVDVEAGPCGCNKNRNYAGGGDLRGTLALGVAAVLFTRPRRRRTGASDSRRSA